MESIKILFKKILYKLLDTSKSLIYYVFLTVSEIPILTHIKHILCIPEHKLRHWVLSISNQSHVRAEQDVGICCIANYLFYKKYIVL